MFTSFQPQTLLGFYFCVWDLSHKQAGRADDPNTVVRCQVESVLAVFAEWSSPVERLGYCRCIKVLSHLWIRFLGCVALATCIVVIWLGILRITYVFAGFCVEFEGSPFLTGNSSTSWLKGSMTRIQPLVFLASTF